MKWAAFFFLMAVVALVDRPISYANSVLLLWSACGVLVCGIAALVEWAARCRHNEVEDVDES